MKSTCTLLITLLSLTLVHAQFKNVDGPINKTTKSQSDFIDQLWLNTSQHPSNPILHNYQAKRPLKLVASNIERIVVDEQGIPSWLEFNQPVPSAQGRSVEEHTFVVLEDLKELLKLVNPSSEFELTKRQVDKNSVEHLRFQQLYQGLEVYGAEIIAHHSNSGLERINGRMFPTPDLPDLDPAVSIGNAQVIVTNDLADQDIQILELQQTMGIQMVQWAQKLVVFHLDRKQDQERLAYMIEVRPNYMDHWYYFIDAHSGEILEKQNHVCSFAHSAFWDLKSTKRSQTIARESEANESSNLILGGDGPASINDTDLGNQTRVVNSYQLSNTYFMIDASRSMFSAAQSTLPDEPFGAIWTIDANGTSPQNDNFSVSHVANSNNNWNPLEVSAHYNGGEAYSYFLSTFGRNSINGTGGNIISMINVTDQNNLDMDNAFWNGYAMFYGNGIEIFDSPLARALDVAGHEMSHGVIQNTANLEYMGQSGALNESYADIFGAMIDREDWKMGEDVIDQDIFQTGALRDLSNPNNGGTKLGDPGWQPEDMSEYQNLPNTPNGDFGGVHINSGIVNHVYYLFATQIGRSKAEQIYFKALDDYLVKSSQFVDARNAVIQAAKDLHGENAPEVAAAQSAFSQVGIGDGPGGDYLEDLEVNPGDDVVISTNSDASGWFYIPKDDPASAVLLDQAPAPLSSAKLSITDNGAAGVYVDQTNNFKVINFDWSSGLNYSVGNLESNPSGGWRNIVVSKDGTKIAYLTEALNNIIRVYDFGTGTFQDFELYNPTTADGGLTTGEVQFADVMEFDYTGEFIMYDALNSISGSFADDIEYWDISFIKVWDNQTNDFGNGQVAKLFSSLPESVSIGNATFAKNSPFIIAFDFLSVEKDIFGGEVENYILKAMNLETGDMSDVFNNVELSYPTYSRLDDQILFDAQDGGGAQVLATVDLQDDKISAVPNTAVVFVSGGSKGTWSQTGSRELNTSTGDLPDISDQILISPNPTPDRFILSSKDMIEEVEISIWNSMGLRVYLDRNAMLDGVGYDIDIDQFPSGFYKVVLSSPDGRAVEKIVKF